MLKTTNRKIHFLEKMWLLFGIVTLILGIIDSFRKPISETYPLFIISGISFFMFTLRRTVRKKSES
jgi:uncharacterized membrane protein HdeD (DUF308 family)